MTAATRPWIVLQHVPWEGPGTILAEATARGLTVEVRRLDLDPSPPAASDIAGLVVMGGPMAVYEADRYPFLATERALIAEMVRLDRPVLGVCLGAQLLAHALGARVYPGQAPEVGYGQVRLTPAGEADPVLGPAGPSISVFHWHGDTFELPAGSTLLASSATYPHQAFRAGARAYGLQFHVELDQRLWEAWQPHLPAPAGRNMQTHRQEIEAVGRAVFRRFLDVVLA